VHAQGAHKVTFHQPEGFGQEQSVRDFPGNPFNDFAPEFLGHGAVKFLAGHRVVGSGGDIPAGTGLWEPETLVMFFGQRHRRVKADDWEFSCHFQNSLDDCLAHGGIKVI